MNTIEETTKTAGCPDWCDGDHVPFSKGNQVHHVSTVLHLQPKPDGSGFDLTHSLCQFQRAEDGFCTRARAGGCGVRAACREQETSTPGWSMSNRPQLPRPSCRLPWLDEGPGSNAGDLRVMVDGLRRAADVTGSSAWTA